MPEGLFPWEFEPVENRRKKYIHQGGLGTPLDGHKNPREVQQHICVKCRARYTHDTLQLEFNDLGVSGENLCQDCQKTLRTMITNHPEMK